jgi:hypothetical protein
MDAEVLVVGGGYYGCRIALHLKELGFDSIILSEKESELMKRASFINQARIHNGYHYPCSLATAMASHKYYSRFIADHAFAVLPSTKQLYGIGKGSRVTPNQFERFCNIVGLPYIPLSKIDINLFDRGLIEAVYEVEESVFNIKDISQKVLCDLNKKKIRIKLSSEVRLISSEKNHIISSLNGNIIRTKYVFNCTYSNVDKIGINLSTPIKKEVAEIALIVPPPELKHKGVTIMDGPFFSCMPFPALNLHSLSHVRYTPISSCVSSTENYNQSKNVLKNSFNGKYMLRDSMRYIPCMKKAKLIGSVFEIKAILAASELNDARPILIERLDTNPNVISICGGKIDNIYDVLDVITHEFFNSKHVIAL